MSIVKHSIYKTYLYYCFTVMDSLLANSNYNYAIIKGQALSKQIYGQLGQRYSSDIDILISRRKIYEIENALSECGFYNASQTRCDKIIMLSASHQVAPWVKEIPPWGVVVIDLNFDIFWGEYEGKRIDIEEFLSDTIEMEIYGVKVKTLPPIKAMIQLILHHYKDMNSIFLLATRKSIKYDMFKDVYYLLKNNLDAIPLDRLIGQASIIMNLIEFSLKHKIIFKDLKYIELNGEFVENEVLLFIKEKLGIAVSNLYGSVEFNGIALTCPKGNMHIIEKNVFVESDINNNILVTGLVNRAMPLIRYDIGDLGKVFYGDQCACGQGNMYLQLYRGRKNELLEISSNLSLDISIFNIVIDKINASEIKIIRFYVQRNNNMFILNLLAYEKFCLDILSLKDQYIAILNAAVKNELIKFEIKVTCNTQDFDSTYEKFSIYRTYK